MNKSENGHGKSRGRESRVCTWEKITKIGIADGEDSDGDGARSHRWRVWQSVIFCLWSRNVHLIIIQYFRLVVHTPLEMEKRKCVEEELKRERGKWERKRGTLLCKIICGRAEGKTEEQQFAGSMGPTKSLYLAICQSMNFWKLPDPVSVFGYENWARVMLLLLSLYWYYVVGTR